MARLTIKTLEKACAPHGLILDEDRWARGGVFELFTPHCRCFEYHQGHCLRVGWGDGEVGADRQEALAEILERLAQGVSECSCEDCIDNLREELGWDLDTPDEVVLDYAKAEGILDS